MSIATDVRFALPSVPLCDEKGSTIVVIVIIETGDAAHMLNHGLFHGCHSLVAQNLSLGHFLSRGNLAVRGKKSVSTSVLLCSRGMIVDI